MILLNSYHFILYRELLQEALLMPLYRKDVDAASFYAFLSKRALAEGWQGNIFPLFLADALLTADNAFSRAAALAPADTLPQPLTRVAQAELGMIQEAARQPLPGNDDWRELAANFPRISAQRLYSSAYEQFLHQLADNFCALPAEELWRRLAGFHQRYGCGPLVRYTFLEWRDGFHGVANADPILPEELFAYERQKAQVMEHIAAFVEDKPAGNLLLTGERGTGKSSLIKAAVNHFATSGLRLLYVPRPAWQQLSGILAAVAAYRQKFIIFLDDFSFEPTDDDYQQIKSVIEGGAAVMPPNALLAATSNRRHLVAESWRDREHKQEDMYVTDTTAEKLALSDRFGLTITFPPPSQQEYFAIVSGLAARAGLELPQEHLLAGAMRWERWNNAPSGRTARQYIDHLLCQ